jgi:hypothetical protein
MTATTANQFAQPAQLADSVTQLLQAAATVRQYMRRIPPDCRSKALAALTELERRIRESR